MRTFHRLITRSREEDGLAMIVAVMLGSAVTTIAVMLLTVGTHSEQSTARGRHFVQALHVTESGIEQAIQRIEDAGGHLAATSFTASTELGDFDVTITPQPRHRYLIESTGGVRRGGKLGSERSIRVMLSPPSTFDAALFSFTSIDIKNNAVIEGDVWGNQSVVMQSNSRVTGDVTAATGYARLDNGAALIGNLQTGGFDPGPGRAVHVNTNASITGDVTASVVTVNCVGADNADYKVRVDGGGSIGGNVVSWGSVTGGGTVGGTIDANSCTTPPPTHPMPGFTYSPSLYDPATLHEYGSATTPSITAITDFQTYIASQGKQISGTFYINQADPVSQSTQVDLTGVTITGDTTIITNTPLFANGVTDNTTDAVFSLISTYKPPAGTSCEINKDDSECSMHIKNNLDVSGNTAVLIYSPYGPVAIKNNAKQFGAVYADNIQVKNNIELNYDPRVERVAGFGPVTYEIEDWQERSS